VELPVGSTSFSFLSIFGNGVKMTIDDWTDEFGYTMEWDHNGNFFIVGDLPEFARVALFKLDDWKVSSVCGDVYYMVQNQDSY